MSVAASTIREHFGLLRDNYILDPIQDTKCFARPDIHTTEIAESLQVDLLTNLAPKRFIWGPYGGGKTHTLMRTMQELSALTPVHFERIECPDLSRRSRFHDLYREGIMRSLGQEFVIGLMEDVIQSVGQARRDELRGRLCEKLGDEEMARATLRINDPNFNPLRLWKWLSGVPLSRNELEDLGQTQDLTGTEAARLADVICIIGRLLKELRGKTLVLVLDEMERLKSIGPETVTTFTSGFTRLVDPNQVHVSILIGTSAAAESELVEVFGSSANPVTSRLGRDSIIEIPPLIDQDVDVFIREVIKYVRDPNVQVAQKIQSAKSDTKENLTDDLYPFTEEAIDGLKSHLLQIMTPREITLKMTRSLGRAFQTRRPAVTSDVVA